MKRITLLLSAFFVAISINAQVMVSSLLDHQVKTENGHFEVSMRWQKGKVVETTIKNCGSKASEVTVKYNGQQQTIHMNIGETKKI